MKRLLSALAAAWLVLATPAAASVVIDFEEYAPGTEAPPVLGPLTAGGAFRIASGLPSGAAAFGYVAPGSPDAGLFLIGDFLFDSVDLLGTGDQDITFTFYNFDVESGALGTSIVFRPSEFSMQTFVFPMLDFIPNFTMVTSNREFYLDNLTGRLPFGSAVPEPASWAMMILGFGVIGAALRRCRGAKPLAAAGPVSRLLDRPSRSSAW